MHGTINPKNYANICLRKQKYSQTVLNDIRWSGGEDLNSGPQQLEGMVITRP